MKRFLLISLFLHALLLSAWPTLWPQYLPAVSAPALSLQLRAPGTQAAPDARQPGDRSLPARKLSPPATRSPQARSKLHEAVPALLPADTAEAPQQPAQTADTRTAEISNSDSETALNNVRAAVHSALQANFSYPHRARLRGWEGTVVITLRILPDGAVTDARISNSSGIRVLDDAALRSIRAVHIPEAIAWIDGRTMDIIIPVEYRLTDS